MGPAEKSKPQRPWERAKKRKKGKAAGGKAVKKRGGKKGKEKEEQEWQEDTKTADKKGVFSVASSLCVYSASMSV